MHKAAFQVITLVKNVKGIIREEDADGPEHGDFKFWILSNYDFSIFYVTVFFV